MTSGSHEKYVYEASVVGLSKFLADTRTLTAALADVKRFMEQPVEGGFGTTQAQSRQLSAAIAAIEARDKYDLARNKNVDARRAALAAPADDKLRNEAEKAAREQLASERRLAGATAAYIAATEKRTAELRKPALDAAKDLGRQLREQREAAQAAADAEMAQTRKVGLLWARDLGRQLQAHAKAEEQNTKDAQAMRRGNMRASVAELISQIKAEERAQKKATAEAEKDARARAAKAAAGLRAAEELGRLYRIEVANQERASAQALSPGRIEALTSRAGKAPDTSTIGRLASQEVRNQLRVDQLDHELEAAKREAAAGARTEAQMEIRLGELAQRRYAAGLELQKTQELLATAMRKRASVEEAEAASLTMGPLARSRASFMTGFRGTSDVPYMQQAGQAMKFSLLYGSAYKALFALTQTFQLSLQEGIAFQQGLSDMALATGRPKEELGTLAERLAMIASDAGASPSQGLEIGARAIGYYGLADSPNAAAQDYAAELSARIVSKMAMGTKVDPVTLQQNIAAVTQAMGMGVGGQIRVADLDQYFGKRFGSLPGDTLEATAQSGSVGIAAGFSIEQIQALAALMIGRTGQTSNAVGGYLAQIFSRGGEGSLSGVAGKYGVDTQQSLAQQFADLSRVYQGASQNQQAEISAAFGRGKVQNAVVAALQSWGEVAEQAEKAKGGAAEGALDKSFAERVGNIGGQLNLLQGDLKEFAHLLGESGMLAVLGAGIEVLDRTVEALNTVLSLYNEINPALRDFIAVLITGAVVGKATGASGIARNALLMGAIPTRMAGKYGIEEVAGAGRHRAEIEGATRVGARGVAEAGKAALASVAPWALAIGGLLAVSELKKSSNELSAAQATAAETMRQAPDVTADPTQLRTYASQLRDTAAGSADAGNDFRRIYFGIDLDKEAKRMRADADRYDALANQVATSQPVAASRLIVGTDKDSLSAGLDRVTAQGGTAADRINALAAAIKGLGGEAAAQATAIDPNILAGPLRAGALDLKGLGKIEAPNTGGLARFNKLIPVAGTYLDQLLGDDKVSASKYAPEVERQLSPQTVRERLAKALAARGVTSYDQLSDDEAKEVSKEVGKLTQTGDFKDRLDAYNEVQDSVNKQILKALIDQRNLVTDAAHGTSMLSNADTVAHLDALKQEFTDKIGNRGDLDFEGKLHDARRWLALAKRTRDRANDAELPAALQAIDEARSMIASTQIGRLEQLRKIAVQNAKTQGQATRVGMGFVRREINIAIRAGDADLLAGVVMGAGKGAAAIARAQIRHALRVAIAAEKTRRALEAEARRQAMIAANALAVQQGFTIGDGPGEVIPGKFLMPKKDPNDPDAKVSNRRIRRLNKLLQVLNYTTYDENADSISEDEEDKDSPAQIRAARMAAWAAKKGGDIAGARAAIAQASADLKDAEKGTVEYYNALASMYQARDQLSDALAAYRKNVRSLRIDATDPVAQARLDLQEARRQLRRDRGKGRDVRAEDRVAVRDSRNALEAAQFSQRLSDVQTAEQLGRISHSAYMRYLQNEHNRLSAIAKRTRQQQDQLNQIDQLMLEAQKSMQGAWNIGDIKLPTPYEVRKYVKEQAGLGGNDRRVMQTTTQVYIDGADVGMVKRVISETVGKNAQVMTVSPRRT